KVCQDQHITKCPVTGVMYSGTAFLVHDSQTIATNLHNVQGWYYHVLKNNPGLKVEDLQPPFLLIDSDDKLAFAPTSSVTMKLSFYNKSEKTFSVEYPWDGITKNTIFFRASDYVELHVSVPFEHRSPLSIGKIIDPMAPLYTIGFPNSQGGGLWVSQGRLQNNIIPTDVNFSSTNTSSGGSSGSPLLNANGEVLGILFSGDETGSQYLSIDQSFLQSVWNSLQ
ncbi:MAG: trypsin-like peptidase domain-containing protein, partial [Bdellovibrionales bacterium]|nr:trypsin-like peptidase domain-containing protein [Bdellovibrionales bacterium]